MNLADGMELGTLIQQKLESELGHFDVQWFKHLHLWSGSSSFFSSEIYETKDARIKPAKVKLDYLYYSTSKSFGNSKFESMQFYDSSRVSV